MNQWVTFVKEYAKKNNLSYGCAISKPECKSDYHKKKDFIKNKSKQHKESIVSMKSKLNKKIVENQLKETSGMQGEDINANPPPVKSIRLKVKKMTPNKAMKENKKVLENQLVETMGMKNEDINVNLPKEEKEKVISKRGRPVKYNTIEEKKAMKLKQTLESNKKMRLLKKQTKK